MQLRNRNTTTTGALKIGCGTYNNCIGPKTPSSPNPQLIYIKKLENFVKNVYSNCAGGPDIDDSVQGLLNAIQNDTLHNDALCAMLGGFPFEKWSSTCNDGVRWE